jgi:TRAP-type C4-dicarboxylate transport system permease small subunit
MSAVRIIASALIIVGLLGLVYGGFNYTRETYRADKSGSFELSIKDTRTVYVPIWVSVSVIVVGWGILLMSNKKT